MQEGKGLIKINGVPLSLYGTPILRGKLYEPVLLLQQFVSSTTSLGSPLERVDIRLRVSGGGHTSQLYALRQAIAKAVVAYVAKYEDAASALEIRKVLVAYDRTLLVADPRRCEPKKFGGKGARSRFQKSCVSCLSLFGLSATASDLTLSSSLVRSRNQLPLKGSEGTERKRRERRRRKAGGGGGGGGGGERRRGRREEGGRTGRVVLTFFRTATLPPNQPTRNNKPTFSLPSHAISHDIPDQPPLDTFSLYAGKEGGDGAARCGGERETKKESVVSASGGDGYFLLVAVVLSVLYCCWLWRGGGSPQQPSFSQSLSLPFFLHPLPTLLFFFYPAFLFPSSLLKTKNGLDGSPPHNSSRLSLRRVSSCVA